MGTTEKVAAKPRPGGGGPPVWLCDKGEQGEQQVQKEAPLQQELSKDEAGEVVRGTAWP